MSNVITMNCDLYWGFFDRVNDMSGKYQVDVCNLSDKAVDALENLGIAVRNKGDERGSFITVKSNNPIHVSLDRDTYGDVVPDMIGNGSKAQVAIGYYDWDFRGKKGRSPSLKKLKVTELNVYSGGEGSDFNFDDAL